MFIRFLSVIALAAGMAACSSGSHLNGETNPGTNPQPEVGLLGTVTNQNGIRDDVNAKLIEKYSATPAILNAAIIFARIEQDAMRMMQSGVAPTQAYFTRLNYAVDCIGKATPTPTSLVVTTREVEAMTYNTPERRRAYMEFNKKLDGFRLGKPKVADPCEAAK